MNQRHLASIGAPLLLTAVFGTSASAAPARDARSLAVRLEYLSAAGCPDAEQFAHVIAQRLGYAPFRVEATNHVLVRLEKRERGFSGHFEWRDRQGQWLGERSFPARTDNCAELARTMAIALAVQIHLLTLTFETPSTSVTEVVVPNAPAPSAPSPASPKSSSAGSIAPLASSSSHSSPRSDIASELQWRFGAGGGVSLGNGLASGSVGLGRFFAWTQRRPLSFEVGAEVGLPTTTRRADGAGYSQQLTFATLAGCGVSPPWSACALAKGGVVRVRGRDIDVPQSQSGAILQAGLRASLSPALSDTTFVAARVEGLATLTRWTVALDGTGVWTAPRFSASVGLDFGVLVP